MRLINPDEKGEEGNVSQVLRFVQHAHALIRNVDTHMALLDSGTHEFPVSINNGDERPDNSYVVSPLTTYTGYAAFELAQLRRPWLEWPMQRLIALIGRHLVRTRIDRIVQINNWLLSTNLYPSDWDGHDLPAMTRFMAERFPDHAIGFRSLNRFSNAALIDRLEALGYVAIPSRQVYLFDARPGDAAAFLSHNNTRMDARLLRNTRYRLVPGEALCDADYGRLEELYSLLYLGKYCPLNPQFSADWLRLGQSEGWLQLVALQSPEGRLDGVFGMFSRGGILSAPVVGYDTALPQKLGLYRLLTQSCLQEAARRQCLLNLSAGSAAFKRLRGGQPEIEYSMVYVDHLSPERQRIWRLLGMLLQRIGVPMIKKLKL